MSCFSNFKLFNIYDYLFQFIVKQPKTFSLNSEGVTHITSEAHSSDSKGTPFSTDW